MNAQHPLQFPPAALAEPAALYRALFLKAAGHLGIERIVAVTLVESLASRPFDECGWTDLQPAICQLQSVVDRVLGAECARRRSDNE
jgi:hypothetical protein